MDNKIKIAFFDTQDYDKASFDSRNVNNEFDITYFETRLTKDTVNLCKGFDTVCAFVNDEICEEVIDALVSFDIKILALRCAGYNNVDITYAKDKIHVVRVPAYSPYAVAEHAMALLLTSIRRIHKGYIRTRDFNFSLKGLTGFDLNGKTVGVVGAGRIGRVFINICKGFGMHVLVHDRHQDESLGVEFVELDELFKRSDVISFHCPLTNENRHIVNKKSIKTMKTGVVIINTSRGGLINSEDLLEGIKTRKIGAACLDVYEEESNVFYHDYSNHIVADDTLVRLISMPNVIVTSHQAFLTKEALFNIADTTLNNISKYFKENQIENEIMYQ